MIADLAARASSERRLAIDTEFVSERRYRALLCLVQVAVPDRDGPEGVRTEVIDPLADDFDAASAAELANVLADPGVEVVMHAGRQDVAILRRAWRTELRNVFDTQVAAGFLGLGSQEGYESLVRKVLGTDSRAPRGSPAGTVARSPRSSSSTPPTTPAASCRSASVSSSGSADQGRLEWAREECRALEEVTDERTAERVYERLPRLARLSEDGRAVARELVEWREEIAEAMDRPAGFVLPDQALMELARRAPDDRQGLEQIRGLPPQTLHRRGDQLLAALERGRAREAPAAPSTPPARDAGDAPLVSLAQALVRQRSMDSGVAVELIATQADLAALVTAARRGENGDGLRVTDGWRRELVGDELRELLAGRRLLGVGPDRTLQVSEG